MDVFKPISNWLATDGACLRQDPADVLCRRKSKHPRILPAELRRAFIADLEGSSHDVLSVGHHQRSGLEQANPFSDTAKGSDW